MFYAIPGVLKRRKNERKNERMKKCSFLTVFTVLIAMLFCGGCALLPAKKEEPPRVAAGLQALDGYAWSCYERGLDYMKQSRFELARQQFSLAASSAVSMSLYEDALDGMHRTEQLLEQSR